jgi:hypothetical protein
MSSAMEFALLTTALIVRFWGIILGRVGEDFLGSFTGAFGFPGP